MNQPNASIRCPHCGLVNFAAEPFCKRCRNSLQNTNYAADTHSVNINITFPPTMPPPRINTQPNNQIPPQFNQPPPQFNHPPTSPDNRQSSEFQLQNQTGFQQWQQLNQSSAQPTNAPLSAPFYPPPGYAPMQQMPSVWRRGGELVLHRYAATLPDACVKCGEQIGGYSGGGYVSQKYRWHNPLVYIALISPIIYCILASVLSQRVKVEIPLCGKHLAKRQSTGKALLSGGAGAVLAIIFFGSFGYVGLSILIALAAFVGVVLGYEYAHKPLQISKIENDYIYLKNADNNYLSRLPPC